MSGFEFSNGLRISTSTLPRDRHRILRVHDIVGRSDIILDYTPKGRDVTIVIEGLEIPLSIARVRDATKTSWNLFDALVEMGWTPPPEDSDG